MTSFSFLSASSSSFVFVFVFRGFFCFFFVRKVKTKYIDSSVKFSQVPVACLVSVTSLTCGGIFRVCV